MQVINSIVIIKQCFKKLYLAYFNHTIWIKRYNMVVSKSEYKMDLYIRNSKTKLLLFINCTQHSNLKQWSDYTRQ